MLPVQSQKFVVGEPENFEAFCKNKIILGPIIIKINDFETWLKN